MPENTTTFDSIDRRQFLRTGVGVAGAAVALSAFTGTAAAHFPDKLKIDIKPKSEKNRIVLGSGGTVTVAVLQTDGFDPTSKGVHYRFGAPDAVKSGGGARPAGSAQLTDVNGDGKMDLVLEFPLAETGFDGDEKTGKLVWERGHKGAEHGLSGTAPVTVIGGEQPTATTQKPTTMTTTGAAPTATTAESTTATGESTATAKTTTTAPTANPATMTTTGTAPTATTGESTTGSAKSAAATGESTATSKTTTTTAQGPGFGLLTALGGIGSLAAYLLTRYTNKK